jgi:uncharacterized protein YbjT (DUF2867 family)
MKIVVIGGSGLIGSKVVERLRAQGHEAVPASPASGVNTITGEGLAAALSRAQVLVDLANSPSFEDAAVLEFFQTAGRNLQAAETAAGVGHHVALSVVGADRAPDSGYLRAKLAQEELIKDSGVPYTIVRSTQFFEFLGAIAGSSADGDTVRLSPAFMQPIAAEDVAAAVTDVALAAPANGTIEIAGPDAIPIDDLVRRYFAAIGDDRSVVTDGNAPYFGAVLHEKELTPGAARIGATDLDTWLDRAAKASRG